MAAIRCLTAWGGLTGILVTASPPSRHRGSSVTIAVPSSALPSATITSASGTVWRSSDSSSRRNDSGRPIVGTITLTVGTPGATLALGAGIIA